MGLQTSGLDDMKVKQLIMVYTYLKNSRQQMTQVLKWMPAGRRKTELIG
jgi:hypothetical protein